jgi:hypothetical protein
VTDIPTSFPPDSFMAALPLADQLDLVRDGRAMTLPAGATLLFEGDLSGPGRDRGRGHDPGVRDRRHPLRRPRHGPRLQRDPGRDVRPERTAAFGVREHAGSRSGRPDPAATFRSRMDENPRIAVAVALRLTRELRHVLRQWVGLEAFDVPARLARSMVDLADRLDARSGAVELPVSQRELAESCGASREAVTKALATFRSRGWVRTGRRSVTVLDLSALRARSSSA